MAQRSAVSRKKLAEMITSGQKPPKIVPSRPKRSRMKRIYTSVIGVGNKKKKIAARLRLTISDPIAIEGTKLPEQYCVAVPDIVVSPAPIDEVESNQPPAESTATTSVVPKEDVVQKEDVVHPVPRTRKERKAFFLEAAGNSKEMTVVLDPVGMRGLSFRIAPDSDVDGPERPKSSSCAKKEDEAGQLARQPHLPPQAAKAPFHLVENKTQKRPRRLKVVYHLDGTPMTAKYFEPAELMIVPRELCPKYLLKFWDKLAVMYKPNPLPEKLRIFELETHTQRQKMGSFQVHSDQLHAVRVALLEEMEAAASLPPLQPDIPRESRYPTQPESIEEWIRTGTRPGPFMTIEIAVVKRYKDALEIMVDEHEALTELMVQKNNEIARLTEIIVREGIHVDDYIHQASDSDDSNEGKTDGNAARVNNGQATGANYENTSRVNYGNSSGHSSSSAVRPNYGSSSGPSSSSVARANYESASGPNSSSAAGVNYGSTSGASGSSNSRVNYGSASGPSGSSTARANYGSAFRPSGSGATRANYGAASGSDYGNAAGVNYGSASGASASGANYGNAAGVHYGQATRVSYSYGNAYRINHDNASGASGSSASGVNYGNAGRVNDGNVAAVNDGQAARVNYGNAYRIDHGVFSGASGSSASGVGNVARANYRNASEVNVGNVARVNDGKADGDSDGETDGDSDETISADRDSDFDSDEELTPDEYAAKHGFYRHNDDLAPDYCPPSFSDDEDEKPKKNGHREIYINKPSSSSNAF